MKKILLILSILLLPTNLFAEKKEINLLQLDQNLMKKGIKTYNLSNDEFRQTMNIIELYFDLIKTIDFQVIVFDFDIISQNKEISKESQKCILSFLRKMKKVVILLNEDSYVDCRSLFKLNSDAELSDNLYFYNKGEYKNGYIKFLKKNFGLRKNILSFLAFDEKSIRTFNDKTIFNVNFVKIYNFIKKFGTQQQLLEIFLKSIIYKKK